MTLSASILLALALAAPIGPQETPKPVGEAAPTRVETDSANQAALSATAGQTARIIQDRDANARNLATYEQAKADYARSLAGYEAEKAAVARKTADDAEAYRRQLEAWRGSAKVRPTPTPVPTPPPTPTVAATKPVPRRHCGLEQPTGSNLPKRACRPN